MQPACTNKWAKIAPLFSLHCNKNQTLDHVVAGCDSSLREKCFNYPYDSILLNLRKIFKSLKTLDLYIDIRGYRNPSDIMTRSQRPDLAF